VRCCPVRSGAVNSCSDLEAAIPPLNMSIFEKRTAKDYNRGLAIIRHNVPKVTANNSFGILRNLTSDNKAIVFTKLLFVFLR